LCIKGFGPFSYAGHFSLAHREIHEIEKAACDKTSDNRCNKSFSMPGTIGYDVEKAPLCYAVEECDARMHNDSSTAMAKKLLHLRKRKLNVKSNLIKTPVVTFLCPQ